jgi:hypothetical protein
MCTVTFIPGRERIFFTSSRDESVFRGLALHPAVYAYKTGDLLFPKDSHAGGSWIALHENGNAVVLLNGAFINHVPNPPYKKSRGLILLELADSASPVEFFQKFNLHDIEPFTAIIWDDERLFESRWDAEHKYLKQLNASLPHIWLSATLYGDDVVGKRKKWFEKWLSKHPFPQMEDILFFHQFTGDGDEQNGLEMNRDGIIFTVSITGMELNHTGGTMHYIDMRQNDIVKKDLQFSKAIFLR